MGRGELRNCEPRAKNGSVRERQELKADLVGCLAIAIVMTLLGVFAFGFGVFTIAAYILCLSLGQLLATPLARANRRRRNQRRLRA
jgi:hypothetical protein